MRDWNLVHFFQRKKAQITYVSPSKKNHHTELLEQNGVSTEVFEANDSRFDSWVNCLDPDIVVFDRFVMEEQFGWRVAQNSPRSLRLLDTQDLHFLRRSRERTLKGTEKNELHEDILRELASIYRSDGTLVISTYEKRLLVERWGVPDHLLCLFPFCYDEVDSIPTPFSERSDFCFIGNYRHPPNRDGAVWFCREVWPLIRKKVKSAQVHLYGAYPLEEIVHLGKQPGVVFHGWIEDHFKALARHRINLAPLRFGAGIKGKITDGWSVGTPAVSTEIGAEGICPVEDFGGNVVPVQSDDFAKAAVALYSDEDEWNIQSRRSLEAIRRYQSVTINEGRLDQFIQGMINDLEEWRRKNIIGSILWREQYRSTEFFSRWIEIKQQSKGCISQ